MSQSTKPFDENLVCPVTGEALFLEAGELVTADGRHRYTVGEDIFELFVNPEAPSGEKSSDTTGRVQDFYTDAPFPNYNDFDDMAVFVERANKGVFARLLRKQIPMNTRLLEVGCGTGQMSNYLAATTMSHVYATDMTLASLKLGMDFARKNSIKGIKFIQMNLFNPCIKKRSMDLVISNGVLHHTADTRAAFLSIAQLVKPGGYIVVGLYNKIGRLRTDLRRHLFNLFGERILFLDPHLRKDLSPEKRRAWILDQYCHPQESKHTISETLGWFAEAGFTFVSSIPNIIGTFSAEEKLFEPKSPGTGFDRFLAEVGMLFSQYGSEGGLCIVIGRKT
ncbi:MAG: class I SAM-dependent methyltransferase [Rhodospirillales bacterium]|nr:class I SAM-dependent methyltransferase [Rhodospirillales bacterium]